MYINYSQYKWKKKTNRNKYKRVRDIVAINPTI